MSTQACVNARSPEGVDPPLVSERGTNMNKRLSFCVSLAAAGLFTLSVAACGAKKPPKPMEPSVTDTQADAGDDADAGPPAPKSLYDRLGGKDGVNAVIDSFLKNAAADADLKKSFAKVTGPKLDHLKEELHDFLCQATGGGCTYGGKDMKTAHKGMGITEKQWDAFVKDFTLAMDEKSVGDKEKGEVLAAVAPLHDDIVEKKK